MQYKRSLLYRLLYVYAIVSLLNKLIYFRYQSIIDTILYLVEIEKQKKCWFSTSVLTNVYFSTNEKKSIFEMFSKFFPSNFELIAGLGLALSVIIMEVFICHYLSHAPLFFTFQKSPKIIENGTYLAFTTLQVVDKVSMRVKTPYAHVDTPVLPFCFKKKCKIPLVVGGNVTLELVSESRTLYKQNLTLPPLSISCTGNDLYSRKCVFHDACYANGIFTLKSPYQVSLNKLVIAHGPKVPTDSIKADVLKGKFATSLEKPNDVIYCYGKSQLVGHEPTISSSFDLFYDYLTPLSIAMANDTNTRLILSPDFSTIPPFFTLISDAESHILKKPMCFEHLTIGFEKYRHPTMTNYHYSYPAKSTVALRKRVVEKIGYTKYKGKTIVIAYLNRNSRVINREELQEALAAMYPGYRIIALDVDHLSRIELIRKVADADVYVAADTESLSYVLWMKPGATIIELSSYMFTCFDAIENFALAADVKYIHYICKEDDEKIPVVASSTIEKCWSGSLSCDMKFCLDKYKTQNLLINTTSFKSVLKKSLF